MLYNIKVYFVYIGITVTMILL